VASSQNSLLEPLIINTNYRYVAKILISSGCICIGTKHGFCDDMNMNIFSERSLEEIQSSREASIEAHFEFIERLVKTNMDVLILSMLSKKPMSGYDLIKRIMLASNVLLNQGSVYSALNVLDEEGFLEARHERGNMRTKIYYITPTGEELTQQMLK
jgi:PadR family transcriptional regulator PadR